MVARTIDVVFTEKGATRVTRAMTDIERTAKRSADGTSAAYDKSANKINTSLQKASGGIKNYTSGLALMGGSSALLATAGLTAVAGGLVSVANASREQERANRLTNAVLASTGGVAGVTARDVDSLSSSYSRAAGVQDEVVQSGANILLSFTRIRNEVGKGNDVFDQALQAALNLSAVYGRDLQSQVIAVGKALNDPVKGLLALSRGGTQFTEQQKEQIRVLVESGKTLQAQKIILRELETQYGGAAAAAADPFQKLNVSVDELKESLGGELIPRVVTFVDLLRQGVDLAGQLPKQLPGGSTGGGSSPNLGVLSGSQLEVVQKTYKAFFTGGPLGVLNLKRDVDVAEAALGKFNAAKKRFDAALQSGASTAELTLANRELQAAYVALLGGADKASGAIDKNANSANEAKFAYLGLGDGIKTAKQAIDEITSAASSPLRANIDVRGAKADLASALDELQNPTSGGASAGSSGQTATAAALERADKEATLRDAIQGVSDADRDAEDAQKELADARKDYNDVLKGVGANTLKAKEAQEAYTAAQLTAKGAAISLRDAHRELSDALQEQATAGREAQEAIGIASRSVAGARLDVSEAKLNLEDAQLGEDPTEIARARIQLGDAIQRQRDAEQSLTAARRSQKEVSRKNSEEDDRVKRAKMGVTDATLNVTKANRDETEALRILNGTLHGFPPASREAQEAQERFTQATRNAREAQDAQRDSARQLERAEADLAGKLDAVASGFGKAEKKAATYQERLDKVTTAILDLADKTKVADQAAGRSMESILSGQIDLFSGYVAAYPALAGALGPIIDDLNFKLDKQRYKNDSFGRGNTYNRGREGAGPMARAMGGDVYKGRAYKVGELGEELFVPSQDGRIVPNHSLMNSKPWSGGNTFHITVHATSSEDLVQKLQEWTRKNGFVAGVRTG